MPTVSVRATPRSPRYSCTHSSSAARWKSRSRTPVAWKVCRYSWPMVPMGTSPRSRASSTLEVPRKNCGSSRASVASTSRCHAPL